MNYYIETFAFVFNNSAAIKDINTAANTMVYAEEIVVKEKYILMYQEKVFLELLRR